METDTYYITSRDVVCVLIVRSMEEVEAVVNQAESPEQCVAEADIHTKKGPRELRVSVLLVLVTHS